MIRAILGFLIVFGSVGGMDTATDNQLGTLFCAAVVGLAIMMAGVNKITKG